MSYVLHARAVPPAGEPFEVVASPRGDLVAGLSEQGWWTWRSPDLGVLGVATWFVNRLVYRGRWFVEVRSAAPQAWDRPSPPPLARWVVGREQAYELTEQLARRIEVDGADVAVAWASSRVG